MNRILLTNPYTGGVQYYYDQSDSDTDSITSSSSSSSSDSDKKVKIQSLRDLQYQDMMKRYLQPLGISPVISVGCQHYKNNTNIYTECCGKYYGCVKCHDEKESHKIDISKINKIVCLICGFEQKPSQQCCRCNILLSKYFCKECMIFEKEKSIFHCKKCKHCNYGKEDEYKHCLKCNSCVKKTDKRHICKKKLNDTCPICLEDLSFGDSQVKATCGHMYHSKCYQELLIHSYKCSICQKTIRDTKMEFQNIDYEIQNTPLGFTEDIHILCNDCEKKSKTKHHYYGTKCPFCKSYNTTQM